ncbi:MAG: T9SS type A sorting domain-containing protein, partial [Bacteroidota bacterium]
AEGRTDTQLDVSGLASGTYFLRMQTEGYTETQRITVVR